MIERFEDITTTGRDSESGGSLHEDEDYFEKFSSDSGWKGMLMLQFQTQTSLAIIIGIYITYIIVVVDASFALGTILENVPTEIASSTTCLIFAFDMFYFIDLISMTIFKNTKKTDMSLCFQERHGAILFVEFLSLVPSCVVYYCMTKPNMKIYYCLRLRYTLRLCRLFHYYSQAGKYAGIQRHVLHLASFLGVQTVFIITLGGASYVYVCLRSETTCEYRETFTMAYDIYLAGANALIAGVARYTTAHIVINNLAVSLFVFVHNMYFTSNFTCDIIELLREKFAHINMYTQFMLRAKNCRLHVAGDTTSLHAKFVSLLKMHFILLWNKNHIHVSSKQRSKIIPHIMYNHILLDIAWTPLKHSHLFKTEDVYFIAVLTEYMTFKHLSRGEIIYKRNEYKSKMVYIISGIVEVLSEEDNETPIFSFSSGTCLGESTLIIDYPSTCSVVSRDISEVAILDRVSFLKTAHLYPANYRRARDQIKNRYCDSRLYRKISEYQFADQTLYDKIGILTIKWMKLTLRSLLFGFQKLGDLNCRYQLELLEKNFFCINYLDLLVLAEEIELFADSVFIKNTFPFVFQPNSILLKTWDMAILFLVSVLVVTYPYFAIFLPGLSASYEVFVIIITIFWTIDLYLRISTAVKTKTHFHKSLADILVYNLPEKSFIIDFLATVPPELFFYIMNGHVPTNMCLFLQVNRLFKVYKVLTFFQNLRGSSSHDVKYKYIKFTLILFVLIYYIASALYLLSCASSSMYTKTFERYLSQYKPRNSMHILFLCIVSTIQFMGSSTLTDFPYLSSLNTLLFLIAAQTCVFVFNSYFLSYVAGAETLNQSNVHLLDDFVRNLDTTMKCFNLNMFLQKRVRKYVKLQVQDAGASFLYEHELLQAYPRDLYVMSCKIHLGQYIRNMDFFGAVSDRVIAHISTIAFIHLLPANEIITQVGEVSSEIYYIIEGNCSVSCTNGELSSLTAGDSFSVLEACLEVPCLNSVKTTTQCKLMSIEFSKLKSIILHHQHFYNSLVKAIDHFRDWKPLVDLQEQTTGLILVCLDIKGKELKHVKMFGYFLRKRTKKYFDFHEGFPKWALPLKFLLLHFTFFCNGRFVLIFEICRCTFAVFSSILFPILYAYGDHYGICYYTCLCLDITAYIDMYLRHHYSYFNCDGVEIFHPYKTAMYYWTHGFLIDLLGCFPFDFLMAIFHLNTIPLFNLNRLLQLYRVHDLFKSLYYRQTTFGLWKMIQYIPNIIVFTNFVAAAIFSTFCVVKGAKAICQKGTWFGNFSNNRSSTVFIYTIFFTTSALVNNNFNIIKAGTTKELLIFGILAVFGYIVYYYVTANVIASNLSINRDLAAYQDAMYNLVKFMSYKRIDKNLKKEIINHFEYMWYRTNGKSVQTAFAPFKKTFKIDALYNIYGMTFANSSIFRGYNQSFFKSLLLDAKHEIYLKTGIIYRVNDVSGLIYLLFKGKVEVVGADSNRLLTLQVGSLFGNIDDCPIGRRTLTTVASGHVEVLSFTSTVFYKHLSKFPKLKNHIRKLTAINTDYLEEHKLAKEEIVKHRQIAIRQSKAVTDLQKEIKKNARCRQHIFKKNNFIDQWETNIISAICFLNYLADLYFVVTRDHSMRIIFIIYFFDFLYLIKIYLKFHTAYEDEVGTLKTSRRDIARRYMGMKVGFYLDLFTIFPTDLISLCCLRGRMYAVLAYVRLNRLARIVVPIAYLKTVSQKLNINVFVVRTISLLVRTVLIQYTLGCLIQFLDFYTGNVVSQENIIFIFLDTIKMVFNCSLNIALYLNSNAFEPLSAACLTVVQLTSRTITILYIAQSCAILRVVDHTRYVYERYMNLITAYMELEFVSEPIQERICSYFKLLWQYRRGVQFPELLHEAPYYLKEAVLNSMFGFHIRKHPVLKHCHVDMVRQMTAQMRTLVFFPGDYITHLGEINHCMYFIEEGEVVALSEDTMCSEVVDHTMHTGDMFGLDQGIYLRCNHEFTYKATMYTILVYLRRRDWIHLLKFFPASSLLIYDEGKET